MPSQKQRKRRKCANCGRPVKGHVGPSGLNRCDNTPMAFQGANNGQSPGGHSTGELSSPESNFPPAPPPAGTQPAQQPASASRPAHKAIQAFPLPVDTSIGNIDGLPTQEKRGGCLRLWSVPGVYPRLTPLLQIVQMVSIVRAANTRLDPREIDDLSAGSLP